MTVFKTFWKILSKNKIILIIYTTMLVVFGFTNMKNNDQSMSFIPEKPDILIINEDTETGLTKAFIQYIKDNSNIKKIENNEEAINDALFYRDVNYIVYIPKNFSKDFLEGKNPEIKVKSSGDYQSSYAEMMVSRYIEVANVYQKTCEDEEELIKNIDEILKNKIDVNVTTKLDTTALQKISTYYSFASYCMLACLILIIGLILNSFNEEKIRKRVVISSTKYKKYNRILLLSNCCYSIILWILYNVMSIIVFKDVMFSTSGLIFIINLFLFTICITALSFLVGTLITNKDALSGISNVIALGSSFLCGAFVPVQWLPKFVVKLAHIFPTYYYIDINQRVTTLEEFNLKTMKPIINNFLIIIGFTILFIILTNILSKKKRKIG